MLSVVIPSFNERNGIGLLVERIHQALVDIAHEVVVVDDSNDGTDKVLERIAENDPELSFHHREGQRGLASAVVMGFTLARGDVLCVMDADLQHPPELLPMMYEEILADADVVIPSRFLRGSRIGHLSLVRKAGSLGGKLLAKVLLHSLWHVSDPLGGFMMFKRSVIEEAVLRPVGWRVQMEVLAMGHYSRIVEIPYAFQRRYADRSKMNLRPLLEDVWHMLVLMARSEREHRCHLLVLAGILCVLLDMVLCYELHTAMGLGLYVSAGVSAACAAVAGHILGRQMSGRDMLRKNAGPRTHTPWRPLLAYGLSIGMKEALLLIFVSVGISAMLANFLAILAVGLCGYGLCARLGISGTARPEIVRRTLLDRGGDT